MIEDDVVPVSIKKEGALVAGKYRVVRLLGQGGMGAVYEVEHVGVKRRFALKVMTRDVSEQKDAVRRFTQEAQAAARIGSPHIVDVFDLGEDTDGSLYMVMELLHGKTLHVALQEKMPVTKAVELTRDLLSALMSAHEHGIVHRDVKPQNLFLAQKTGQEEAVLKVLDFGIAKFRETEEGTVSDATKSGVVVGTPLYMAPEQVMGEKEIDGRVDVWAAGATLFEMLTGRSVHLAPNATAAAVRVVTEKAPRVDAIRKDVDVALADIVEKALSIEREQRFDSASDMRDALTEFLEGPKDPKSTAAGGAAGDKKAAKNPSRTWLVGLAAFALGVALVALLFGHKPAATPVTIATENAPADSTNATATTATASATPSALASASASPSALASASASASPSALASASASPSASASASASAPPSASASASAPASAFAPPRVAASSPPKIKCAPTEALSSGHCCPSGHVWEQDRCARPMATSFP